MPERHSRLLFIHLRALRRLPASIVSLFMVYDTQTFIFKLIGSYCFNIILLMGLIPGFYKLWLVISSILVIWDTVYVLYRPATMKGGTLFFYPYDIYITIDTLYGNMIDTFVVIQSKCNIVEVILFVISLIVSSVNNNRAKLAGALLCIVASCFTFWKTVIYVMYGYPTMVFRPGNELVTFGVFILPTSLWLILPLLGIYTIGNRIINRLSQHGKQE
jgi:hypothetical protein